VTTGGDANGIRAQYRNSITHNAFIMDNQRSADIPTDLRHLIQSNVAYRVLICPHNKCRKAVQPEAYKEHLLVRHKKTLLPDRQRVQTYVTELWWNYDYSTILLPKDESAPQLIILVVNRFQCQTCLFKSSNRKRIKVHRNKEHKQLRVTDYKLFKKV
jgi:hypothetical protein